MSIVANQKNAIDSGIFIEEMHVVEDSSSRPIHIIFVRFVLFASQKQISYRFRITVYSEINDNLKRKR